MKLLDLCCGAGGWSLGAKLAGWGHGTPPITRFIAPSEGGDAVPPALGRAVCEAIALALEVDS